MKYFDWNDSIAATAIPEQAVVNSGYGQHNGFEYQLEISSYILTCFILCSSYYLLLMKLSAVKRFLQIPEALSFVLDTTLAVFAGAYLSSSFFTTSNLLYNFQNS